MSDILATVLIVLLALAAVAIVWAFLKPLLDTTGAKAQLRTTCFESDIEAKCNIINSLQNETNLSVSALVKVNHGNLYRVLIVYYLNDSTSAGSVRIPSPDVLATSLITRNVTVIVTSPITPEDYLGKIPHIGITPIVRDEDGNEDVCSETIFKCDYTPTCSPGIRTLCTSSNCIFAGGSWSGTTCT